MRTTAKVFIWIGMIIQFYLIFPIIVGVLALKKIDKAQSKEELQTMGILTTFFCSVLGGIFMLSIKNEELTSSSPKVVVTKTKITEKERIQTDKNQRIKKIISICFFGITFTLMLISLFFSISPVVSYYGTTFIPLILNSISLAVLIIAFILYLKNKRFFNIPTYVLLLVFISISIAQIPICIVSFEELSWNEYISYHYYLREYYTEFQHGVSWEYWVVFGISIFLTITSSAVLIYNFITRKVKQNYTKEIKQVKYVTKSNVESELLEVQRLFDNKIVTEEEYNKMRNSVISKYYK